MQISYNIVTLWLLQTGVGVRAYFGTLQLLLKELSCNEVAARVPSVYLTGPSQVRHVAVATAVLCYTRPGQEESGCVTTYKQDLTN